MPEQVDEKFQHFGTDDGHSCVRRRGEPVTWPDCDAGLRLVGGHDEPVDVPGDDEAFSSAYRFPNGRTARTGVMQPPAPVRAVPIEQPGLLPGAHRDPGDVRWRRNIVQRGLSTLPVQVNAPGRFKARRVPG